MDRLLLNSRSKPEGNRSFKVTTLGDSGVGKSSIINYYTQGYFDPSVSSTIGAAFKTKRYNIDDRNTVTLELWDTAGQERFRSILPMYLRNADAIVLVFDVNNTLSLENLKTQWLPLIEDNKNRIAPHAVKVIIANKIDHLVSSSDPSSGRYGVDQTNLQYVNIIAAERIATDNNYQFFQTSAKQGLGVDEVYDHIFNQLKNLLPQSFKSPTGTVQVVDPTVEQPDSKCFGCF